MSTLKSNEQKEKEIKNPWTQDEKELLISLYSSTSNMRLCEVLNKTEEQIKSMKSQLGLNIKFKPFTEDEKEKIRSFYLNNLNQLNLQELADLLGRPKTSISRYAKKIGLTNSRRSPTAETVEKSKKSLKSYRETEVYVNEVKPAQVALLTYYAQNEHPRGMLGKHHSPETREKISESHVELFANMSSEEKHKRASKSVATRRKAGTFRTTPNAYSRCRGGKRDDLNCYFRSAWKANVARILNYKSIKWEYEYKRFDFYNETEGVLSYQPDFYLPEYNKWLEVKGWMDEKSKKRLELFQKYYPDEFNNLILIDEDVYNSLAGDYKHLILNWE